MDVDTSVSVVGGGNDEISHDGRGSLTDRCVQRRSHSTSSSASQISPIQRADPQLALVSLNPKPRAPVATLCFPVPCPRGHDWKITSANAFARGYLCGNCYVNVKERKKDGYWVPRSMTVCARRDSTESLPKSSSPLPCARRASSPDDARHAARVENNDAALNPAVEVTEDLGDDLMSIYESAEENSPRPSLRKPSGPPASRRPSIVRDSLGASNSDFPSPLAGLSHLRRVSGRAGADVSIPLGRLIHQSIDRMSSTVPQTSASHVRVPPLSETPPRSKLPASKMSSPRSPVEAVLLVSDHPKPLMPMTNCYPPRCSERDVHAWKFKWAGPTQRHYICTECEMVVKERKVGQPQRWAPV